MPRRTIYYVVLVTLLWGAFAENEEQSREIFQSNMTRNDFSNLLKSLIKLNEQRVSVLQKLYRLEDYGVLSEVLRTGNKKARNGNQNLFLVVMSKNQSLTTRRDMGNMQVVDSVPSLDILKNKIQTPELSFKSSPLQVPVFRNMEMQVVDKAKSLKKSENTTHETHEVRARDYPKLQYVLEKDSVRYNPLKKDIIEVVLGSNMHPKAPIKKHRFEIEDERHFTITTSKERVEEDNRNPNKLLEVEVIDTKHPKIAEDNHNGNYPKISLITNGENKKYIKKVKGRYDIVSNGRNEQLDAKQESLEGYTHRNYPLISRDTSHDKIDESTENYYSKKLKIQKDVVSNEDDESHKYTKANIEMSHENDHSKYNSSTINKSNENNHGGKYPQIVKDRSDEHYNGNKYPKITRDISTEYDHSYKGHKEIIIHESGYEQNHGNKYSKVDGDIYHETDNSKYNPSNKGSTYENANGNKYPTIIRDNSNENNHGNKYPKFSRDHSNENDHDNKYPKLSKDHWNENDHGNIYPKITGDNNDHGDKYPKGNKDSYNENYHGETLAIEKEHNDNYSKTGKDMTYEADLGSNNPKTAKDASHGEDYDNYDKMSMEIYDNTKPYANPRKDKYQENGQKYPKSNPTGFVQPDGKPESRKNFQKCISKKALKLCSKSCIEAYKNVCRRLKCTSRSKKALKKECKRSCKKSFATSKYSNEDRS